MLRMYESEKILIDTKNNEYKYTYQVLDSIRKEYKDDEIFLIMGDDLIYELNKWEHLDEILQYKILVMKRNDRHIDMCEFSENKNFIIVENYNVNVMSSTCIREKLYNSSKEEMMKYLDENIYDFIIANNFYKTKEGEDK